MEQVYRRRGEHRGNVHRRNESRGVERSYKQMMVQQALICVLLFIAALFMKMSPQDNAKFVNQSIQYILTHQVDFVQYAENVKDFFSEKILKKTQEDGDLDSLTNLILPVNAEVVSEFGMQIDPVSGKEKFHYGIDFSAAEGEKIKCVFDGTAEEIGINEEYGNYILIRHGEKYASFYAHCDKILPVEGDSIKAGQVIATVGCSGNVSIPCLHFEIREGETSLDPSVFLDVEK